MTERTCSIEDCGEPLSARGLCNRHYLRACRAGDLKPTPNSGKRHRLSNLDVERRVADCVVCGLKVPVKVRSDRPGRVECLTPRRTSARKVGRARRFRQKYGITEADWQSIYDKQDGRCAICEQPAPLLVVDHCHKTGSVRGLLCRPCNLSLGYLRDDSYSAVSAAKYLMKVIRDRSA